MRLGEIRGKSVVSLAEARKVGVVDDVLVDARHERIEALRLKSERDGPSYVVSSDDVRGFGPDAVTIDHQDALMSSDRMPGMSGLRSLSAVLNSRVVTEDGRLLGTVSEVDFDPASRRIRRFEFGGEGLEGLLGRKHSLDPEDVVGIGPGLVTVRNEVRPSRAA